MTLARDEREFQHNSSSHGMQLGPLGVYSKRLQILSNYRNTNSPLLVVYFPCDVLNKLQCD